MGSLEVEKIYQVLKNKKRFQESNGTYNPNRELSIRLMGKNVGSMATSELLATSDQIIDIRDKAAKIRTWLLLNGEFSKEEEFETKRIRDTIWFASVDTKVDESNTYLIFLAKNDSVKKIDTNLAIHFDEMYEILIEFPRGSDPKKAEVRYERKKKLNEMAENEAIIALDLMNEFMYHKEINQHLF